MIIQAMEENHIPQIARLESLCFSAPWTEKMLAEELENVHACFLVALEGQQVLGYVGCHMVCDEGYIANVAVDPSCRRRGIGRMLIQALYEKAMEKKLSFLSLEVRKSNDAAQSLYTSCGFETAGIRKNFYSHPTEDGVIMTYQVSV